MNRLEQERSPYLRHAASQKIRWYPWSEEAFNEARLRDVPVFLSSGAAWCHWCHVMAKESFEDGAVADLLNELFVCIKLDRDERPEIDRTYQQAVGAMGGSTGWPLSVFLTPGRKPFFGGTYFPPEDRQGTPGFRKVLKAASDLYRTKKSSATAYAESVIDVLRQDALPEGELEESGLERARTAILSGFDPQYGGFGTAPKFPMPGALEFLLRRYATAGDAAAGAAARMTLLSMARGGFHDQLGGGFHRYSVDESWAVPHFEKKTDDNAWLLRNYAEGYALLGLEPLRRAAEDIIRFAGEVLAGEDGGFYASQDADVTPDDEGGYFTWSERELRETLEPAEYEIVSLHLTDPRASMHHDPSRMVLAVRRDAEAIADLVGKSPAVLEATIERAKEKLLSARRSRKTPLIDRTLYTSYNGMMIAAYLRAYLVLGNKSLLSFGLKSLERVLREGASGEGVEHSPGVRGGLEDYIHLADALLGAYEATAERAYLDRAEHLMALCSDRFLDPDEGGFFDAAEDVLGTRAKRIEDVPLPSANAVAILVLIKLFLLTGKESYEREAGRSLRIFSRPAQALGAHAGSYYCALSAFYRRSVLTIEAAPDTLLAEEARRTAVRSYSAVAHGADNARVVPCLNRVCGAPIQQAGDIALFHFR